MKSTSASEKYFFFCQNNDGDIAITTKEGVDASIKYSENNDEELDFTVIAKIPAGFLTHDISPSQIQWYKPENLDKKTIDAAVIAVSQFLNSPEYRMYGK